MGSWRLPDFSLTALAGVRGSHAKRRVPEGSRRPFCNTRSTRRGSGKGDEPLVFWRPRTGANTRLLGEQSNGFTEIGADASWR